MVAGAHWKLLRIVLRTSDQASELGRALGERDRLLLYFAGHGLSRPSEQGPEGHLLLADARPDDTSTFLEMAELWRLIGALPCRHVLIVLDCCFAGTFRWAGRRAARNLVAPIYQETLDRFVHHQAWQVLVSASHDQTALDDVSQRSSSLASTTVGLLRADRIETERQSPFAAAFLRALGGAADFTKDGLIIATELELFVRDAVEQATHVHQTARADHGVAVRPCLGAAPGVTQVFARGSMIEATKSRSPTSTKRASRPATRTMQRVTSPTTTHRAT